MFDVKLVHAHLDARVLAALGTVPDSDPLERVAELAGVDMQTLRASMFRLALRQPGKTWPAAEVPS
jgi:hypothetical protein